MKDKEFKILVVDDCVELASSIKEVLELKKYSVEIALSGKEAIEICKNKKFDLILLDFNLPDIDGLTIHKQLEQLVSAEFIIITGYGSLESATEAVSRKSIVGYELKPIDLNRLLSLIKQIKKRRELEKSLIELETNYKTIVDNSFDGIVIIKNGKIKFCNTSFAKIFNFDNCETILNKSIYNFINKKSKSEFKTQIKELELNIKQIANFEFYGLTSDKKEKILEASCTKINYKDEVALLLFIKDISEEKKLVKELYHAQKMEALGRFASSIAHDFNNIATVIIGNAELIMNSIKKDNPIYKDITELYNAAQRALDFANQLVAFSKKENVEPKKNNINEIILNMENILLNLIGENITLTLDLDKNLWDILIDKTQFEQIIMNLIINAKDAMPDGGKIVIKTKNITDKNEMSTVAYNKNKDYVMVSVQDTGIGIPEDLHDKIFEPFFTTKEPGKGSGLGLSIVYGIIKQYEGYIHLTSFPKKGTEFKIFLPAIRNHKPKNNHSNNNFIFLNKTIVIADDEKEIRDFITNSLKIKGFNLMHARNAEELIELCKKHKEDIDLILLDLLLLSNKNLKEKINKIRNEFKFLYMNNNQVSEKNHLPFKLEELEENEIIQKPFTEDILLSKIKKIFEEK